MISSVPVKRREVEDHITAEAGHFESFSGYSSHGGGGGHGYSVGSGLKNIAQGSAEQANNAVVNQHSAARQAAFVAKSTLAQTALAVSKDRLNLQADLNVWLPG